jgi:hypothetical protein
MKFAFLRTAGTVLALVVSGTLTFGDEKANPAAEQIPEFVRVMPDSHKGVGGCRTGRVTAMDKDSVTVEFPDPYKEWTFDTDEKRRPIRKLTFIYPAVPPQELKLRGSLAEGQLPERTESVSYRITDVRIGDRVVVNRSSTREGLWFCDHIMILRRPGGKVPEAPHDTDSKSRGYAWHEHCQAHQDFEEKGIPIPDKFLPGYKDKIAPPPHEVKAPRIPNAEP